MSFNSLLQNVRSALAPRRSKRKHGRRGSLRAATHRLAIEALEDRCLLAFIAPVDYAAGTNPQAIVSADFNGGGLDLAVANYSSSTVIVLLGDGLGGFGATTDFATANGTATAGSDYTATAGDVIIAHGQFSRTLTVAVTGDRLAEPTETFVVNLSAPVNAGIADGQGVGAILDNEPRISISDVSKKEGKKGQTTLFTFTVTLSAACDQTVTMSYRTVNGTATTGGGDYIAKTGTLSFAPGETTKTITIEVKGDNKQEANETFYLDLFDSSSNSLFTKNRGTGTILNDD